MMTAEIEGRHTDIVQEYLHAVPYKLILDSARTSENIILDVGVGDAAPLKRAMRLSNAFASQIVGVDLNYSHLRSNSRDSRISSVLADGVYLPFRDESFTAAISSQVIEHIEAEKHPGFVGELVRVVKPGGKLIIATLNREFPFNVKGHADHKAEFDLVYAIRFARMCEQWADVAVYAVIPSQRYINAQAIRARFWYFRAIKDRIPRRVTEWVLTLLTRGEITPNVDMQEDFSIIEMSQLEKGGLFTDFIFELTKRRASERIA